MENLNYSDFVLDSEYRGIYQGAINNAGTSGKYDLLSATTPVDRAIGLVTAYYPLEYKHSVYALGDVVDEKSFPKTVPCCFLLFRIRMARIRSIIVWTFGIKR